MPEKPEGDAERQGYVQHDEIIEPPDRARERRANPGEGQRESSDDERRGSGRPPFAHEERGG